MNCPHCSAYIKDPNADICNICGNKLNIKNHTTQNSNIINQPSQPVSQPTAPQSQKNRNTLVVSICAVIIIAIICATVICITVINKDKPVLTESTTQSTTGQTAVQSTEAPTYAPTTTAPPTTQTPTQPVYHDSYIFPTHNTYLTFEILSMYSENEIDLICNEMYARHGQIFKKQKNIDYFSQQSWYRGEYTSMDYVVTLFNHYEEKNLQIIAEYREYRGWN